MKGGVTMKIILQNINYKGHHFENLEFEFSNIHNFEDIPEGKLMEYIEDMLDTLIKHNID